MGPAIPAGKAVSTGDQRVGSNSVANLKTIRVTGDIFNDANKFMA